MQFGTRTQEEFTAALQSFYEGCQRIHAEYWQRNEFTHQGEPWELRWLQKRVLILHGGSAHTFVDMATGDVLKPASWKAPAKHARGNIYDDKNGLGSMGPHGPAYLR